MTLLRYDGTFEGYCTAVFMLYDLGLLKSRVEVRIVRIDRFTDELFSTAINVHTDTVSAERVSDHMEKLLGRRGRNDLWRAWLSGLPEIEDVLTGVITYAISTERNVLKDYTNEDVVRISRILKMVSRERHRMTAFVRFKKDSNGLFFATVEPDFDVLPLISDHFKSRYADQRWLIFDTKRAYGIYFDGEAVVTVDKVADDPASHDIAVVLTLDATELEYQRLWKGYYSSTDIAGRRNMKLHLRHVPRRYWKYLVEK